MRLATAEVLDSQSWSGTQKGRTSFVDEPTSPESVSEQLPVNWLAQVGIRQQRVGTQVADSAPRGTLQSDVIFTAVARATLLAEWSGCVLSIDEHYFYASLKGVNGEGIRGELEEAEIPISDVSESDMELLRVGHFFRLCVFYEVSDDGQPRRYTQVVFRRLPAYRNFDLEKAARRGEELFRGLRVE